MGNVTEMQYSNCFVSEIMVVTDIIPQNIEKIHLYTKAKMDYICTKS